MALLLLTAGAYLEATAQDTPSLEEMGIEQLLNQPVTTVSKREEKFSDSAAAIDVITHEDIRHSGALTIPDLLRLVPGLNVAQVDAHQWAISSRGFNDAFANKLLVLIDGRSVYTPLFSGVFWDVQDTVLEDVDRIEVVRGPGAALWGANAVNGVINILTKSSRDTQGWLLSGSGGNTVQGLEALRYGGKIGEDAHFRVFGKFRQTDHSELMTGGNAADDWNMVRGGFRIDWDATDRDLLTLQGDLYSGRLEQIYQRISPESPFTPYATEDVDRATGGDVLVRWVHTRANGNQFVLQTYYDNTYRDTPVFRESRNTYDVDLQHTFAAPGRQTITWGGGYRLLKDHVGNTFDISLLPDRRSLNVFSAFAQDEIQLIENRLVLTLGSKFEHNDFTGFEVQPNARLLWKPTPKSALWASAARAVRTPSRAEENIHLNQAPVYPTGAFYPGFAPFVPPSPAAVTSISGSPDFKSEELLAFEAGYRVQPLDRLSFDAALFYNQYDHLRSAEPVGVDLAGNPPNVAVRVTNLLKGETYGGEISATMQMTDWWRCRATYSHLEMRLHTTDGGNDATTERLTERSTPQNQFTLVSSMDFPHGFEADATLRYVDSLPAFAIQNYLALDLRIGWKLSKNVELSVVGRNLLDNLHPEYYSTTIPTQQTEVGRSVYGRITVRF